MIGGPLCHNKITGGIIMDERYNSIVRDLKTSLQELKRNHSANELVQKLIEDEKADIEYALRKAKDQEFGRCEISGEFIPFEILSKMPTAKTIHELQSWVTFGKKTLH